MMRWLFLLCMYLLLSGCQAKSDAGAESSISSAEAVIEVTPETEGRRKELPAEEIISFLEGFETDLTFTDMAPEEAVSYGKPLEEFYEFTGRKTEEGFGYVLAVLKTEKDPLKDLTVYLKDYFIVAEAWDEQLQDYEERYSFEGISSLSRGDGGRVLYLQPTDYVSPEELQSAFEFQYCKGEEGVSYLQDMLERGVRFTPPDNGAYLSVGRYEDGNYFLEHIPLTVEEEKEILNSDEIADPVSYANYGIEFFVSQQTYENEDIQDGTVTAPALKIAEERGKFQKVELLEIHDITKAELRMKMREYDKDTGMKSREWEETETITDPEDLKILEDILSGSEPSYEGKCPYTGILTLTRKDGGQVVLHLAMDSCDGFILGSHAVYSAGEENTEKMWELFSTMRENTGW